MKFMVLFALLVAVKSDFSCVKPVNPIPAGPPGLCCQELVSYPLLGFLYAGKTCTRAMKLEETVDGTTTYSTCEAGLKGACCDPVLTKLGQSYNIACVLPA